MSDKTSFWVPPVLNQDDLLGTSKLADWYYNEFKEYGCLYCKVGEKDIFKFDGNGWKLEAPRSFEWMELTEDILPTDCETYLTYHKDDLYPVCAFYEVGSGKWLRQLEGPEDGIGESCTAVNGWYVPLLRDPTHIMHLNRDGYTWLPVI